VTAPTLSERLRMEAAECHNALTDGHPYPAPIREAFAILAALHEEAAARIDTLERIDSEAATHVESVICLRTHFTGEPPYLGWKGLGLALTETLDRQAAEIERLTSQLEAAGLGKAAEVSR
jgi:hypothetical protein